MVELGKINEEVVRLNHCNLKRCSIPDLLELQKENTWKGEVVQLSNDFKKLVRYVLERRNLSLQ